MMLRQFLLSFDGTPPERRAEAAAALARAYLYGDLASETAWEAKTALLALLDDPSPLVRRALAEACAGSSAAPRPLIAALASDQPEIACLVLARSPVLMEADLVDCAAIAGEAARAAIAGRADLTRPVAAALAEVAGAVSLAVLARNPRAEIGTAALLRMVERHGDDAALREALLMRADLGVEVRHALAGQVARALSALGQARGWLSRERGERIGREARDGAALSLSDEAGEAGLARLVAHLRCEGELTAGLILRAILTLRMAFAEAALADLSTSSRTRVAGLMREPRGAAFAALLQRAGLPDLLLSPIRAALGVWCEARTARDGLAGPRLARRMIEQALTACEDLPFAESRGLLALLARFEAEAARQEVRQEARQAARQEAWQETRRAARREPHREAVPEAFERDHAAPARDDAQTPEPDMHAIVPTAERRAEDHAPSADDRFARVLDELPQSIAASLRTGSAPPATDALGVLDGLGEALLASFLAGRPSTDPRADSPASAIVPSAAAEMSAAGARTARPRRIAEALVAEMLPAPPEADPRPETPRLAA